MRQASHKYRPSAKRKSRIKGECEAGFWWPLKHRWGRYFDAAAAFQVKAKRPGQRYGPLGPYGVQVFKVLVQRTGRKGRLELSLETIAKLAGCCRSAAVAALKLLRDNGFVRWINRYIFAGDKEGSTYTPDGWGPQVWQTTNAYAVDLPEAAAVLAPERAPAPGPVDDDARRADLAAQLRAMADDDETGLAGALNRLGRLIQGRDPPD